MKRLMLFGVAIIFLIVVVGAVDFDNKAYFEFEEGSGTSVEDVSTNSFNLELVNSPTWKADEGKIRNGVQFDGVNDYAINESADLNLLDAGFSVQVWVNATDFTNNLAAIIHYINQTSNVGFSMTKNSGVNTVNFAVATPDGSATTNTGNLVALTNWYHIVGVYNESDVLLYLNGTFVTKSALTTAFADPVEGNLTVGRHGYLSDSSRSWKGIIDEVGIWNRALTQQDITELYNDKAGLRFPSTLEVTLNSPTNTSQITTLDFNYTLDPGRDVNLTNATLFIYNSTGDLVNDTFFETITGNTTNTSVLTMSSLQIGDYSWNLFGCGINGSSDSICEFSENNNSFTYGFKENAVTFTTPVGDLTPTTIILNITAASSVISSFANLDYNGTLKSSTKSTVGPDTIFTTSFDTPAVNAQDIKNFHWALSLTDSFGTTAFNTTKQQQTVTPSNFTACSVTLPTLAVNYTIFDEADGTTPLSATFDGTFNWNFGTATSSKNVSVSLTSEPSHSFCVDPNQTYITDATILLEREGYSDRLINLDNQNYSNNSITHALYMVANATDVIIEVKNPGLQPLVNYLVEIERFYPSTGNYLLVESQKTDDFGQFVARLVENDVRYRFTFYNTDNVVVKTTQDISIACRSTICLLQFVVEDSTNDFERFDDITDYDGELTYDEGTETFTFSWTDTTGDSPTHRLLVERFTFNNTAVVCNVTSTSLASSLPCDISSYSTGSFTAQAFRTTGGDERRVARLTTKLGDISGTFGLEGLFWSFILLLTLIAVGAFSPVIGVGLFLIGFIALGVMGVLSFNIPVFIAMLVIGIVFIWAFRT